MTSTDAGAGTGGSAWSGLARALIFLAVASVVLGVVFRNSFSPEQVLFSNDAPLGLISSEWCAMPAPFKGFWVDLNWLGSQAPSAVPNLSFALLTLLGPLAYAKWMAPAALLMLGFGAWMLFRVMGLAPAAAIVGGLAAALNMNFFSNVAWGLGSRGFCAAFVFLALAAIYSHAKRPHWAKMPLAGLAVGMVVMEGYDVGAIFSLYVAAFALFTAWHQPGSPAKRLMTGAARVVCVAGFAAFLAASAVITLVETQVKGVAGNATPDDPLAAKAKWDFATQWSLPKIETMRVLLPGVFGYGMPEMYSIRPENYGGAQYWGAVGQSPGNERSRFSGAGEYAGVAVVLLALWAVLQSFRGPRSPLSGFERRSVQFWAAAALISLVLAWGRHAPLYQVLYALPYFSTIRNPIKFMNPFQIALLILCAHGLLGFWKCYLSTPAKGAEGPLSHVKSWLKRAPLFEKRWAYGTAAAVVLSFLGWMIYSGSKPKLTAHLNSIIVAGYESQAADMAAFSIADVGGFVLFLLLSGVCLVLLMSGFFAGPRQRWAALLLGAVLVADLAKANAPWLIYYDYKEKYASDPILDLLRKESAQHRVQVFPFALNHPLFDFFHKQYYYVTWLQNLFQYYNIRSLDIIQEPRMGADKAAYKAAFEPSNIASMVRYWELTNTRYHFGLAGPFVDQLNQQIDPVKKRFKQRTAFTLAEAKPGSQPTVTTNAAGPLALIEFTGALPRAGLYASWENGTGDDAVLKRLIDPAFDPLKTVVLSDANLPPPTAADAEKSAGTVEMKSYAPKRIVYQTQSGISTVLMMNDRFAPDWKVWVDGKPQPLLRCNFIMRGVALPPGGHEVEFRFEPGYLALYLSLAAIGLGLGLCGLLAFQPATSGNGKARD